MTVLANASSRSFAQQIWPAATRMQETVRNIGLVLLGNLLLYISAKVVIPFYPVPATLQTLVLVVLGAAYGPRLAFATVAAYLAEGAMGLPVFTGTGAGVAYMMSFTGGYLAGFLVAAPLTGYLVARGAADTFLGALATAFVANVVIYVPGLAWLGSLIGFDKALVGGFLNFVYSDAVKLLLATSLMAAGTKLIRR